MLLKAIVTLASFTLASAASAANVGNEVKITIKGDQRCISSNALPDHETGTFPNRGNPNGIRSQRVNMCVPLNPTTLGTPKFIKGTSAIAVNGVQYRPNTAGFWDPNGRRGHSRNGNKNWSLDIFGARGKLGLDFNNAHVGPNGLYHYHGIAKSLTKTSGSSLIGYAGDGYELHYVGDKARSGYHLKKGMRPAGGPEGAYSGLYNEDFEFISAKGTLDECNGGTLNGKYVYFITNSYPFAGRCLRGKISSGFGINRH